MMMSESYGWIPIDAWVAIHWPGVALMPPLVALLSWRALASKLVARGHASYEDQMRLWILERRFNTGNRRRQGRRE